MRNDWRLGVSMLVAAAFAVAISGCASDPKPAFTTAHPDTAAAAMPEPTPSPAAMVERAEAAVPPPAAFVARAELVDLRFRPGQIDVAKADFPALDSVVRWLMAHPRAVVMIEGHTDDVGGREANLVIGEKRALSIEKYLVDRGIEPGRVSVASAGSDRPVCDQKTDACRAKNRRARFLVKQP